MKMEMMKEREMRREMQREMLKEMETKKTEMEKNENA